VLRIAGNRWQTGSQANASPVLIRNLFVLGVTNAHFAGGEPRSDHRLPDEIGSDSGAYQEIQDGAHEKLISLPFCEIWIGTHRLLSVVCDGMTSFSATSALSERDLAYLLSSETSISKRSAPLSYDDTDDGDNYNDKECASD
jgi:hypothetical protein